MEIKSEKKEKSRKKKIKIPPLKIRKNTSRNKNSNLHKSASSEKRSSKEDNLDDNETYFTQDKEKEIKRLGNEIRKFENIYSPRTTFVKKQENEEKLFHELCGGFDPITIKIMKTFFKERLGQLNKQEFIGFLQKNLLLPFQYFKVLITDGEIYIYFLI